MGIGWVQGTGSNITMAEGSGGPKVMDGVAHAACGQVPCGAALGFCACPQDLLEEAPPPLFVSQALPPGLPLSDRDLYITQINKATGLEE